MPARFSSTERPTISTMSTRARRSWTKAGGITGISNDPVAGLQPSAQPSRVARRRSGRRLVPAQTAKSESLLAARQRRLQPARLQAAAAPGFSGRGIAIFRGDLVAAGLGFLAPAWPTGCRDRRRSGHIRPSGRGPSRPRRRAPVSWFARSARSSASRCAINSCSVATAISFVRVSHGPNPGGRDC